MEKEVGVGEENRREEKIERGRRRKRRSAADVIVRKVRLGTGVGGVRKFSDLCI